MINTVIKYNYYNCYKLYLIILYKMKYNTKYNKYAGNLSIMSIITMYKKENPLFFFSEFFRKQTNIVARIVVSWKPVTRFVSCQMSILVKLLNFPYFLLFLFAQLQIWYKLHCRFTVESLPKFRSADFQQSNDRERLSILIYMILHCHHTETVFYISRYPVLSWPCENTLQIEQS